MMIERERPDECLMCDSTQFEVLGYLGQNMWVRCRMCGLDIAFPADTFEKDD